MTLSLSPPKVGRKIEEKDTHTHTTQKVLEKAEEKRFQLYQNSNK